jgi:FHA domain
VTQNDRVRFEQTRALDAIERRLATDPLRTGGVVEVAEALRFADLDGGRDVSLLRLGMLVDGLARLLGDGGVALYPVAERGLLSDTELTSNERMVLRRWSDDGLLEILPAGAPALARAGEVSALTGQPVLTRAAFRGYALRPTADGGGAVALVPAGAGPSPVPDAQLRVLTRMWRCPVSDCPSFGRPGFGQSPPQLAATGVPTCPRHGERLTDAGARPPVVSLVVRIGGLVRQRFAVATGMPVLLGRAPDQRGGVSLGPLLDEPARGWISRRHLTLDLRPDGLYATDTSTNGTIVVSPQGRGRLPAGEPRRVGERDVLELFEGVEVARAGTAAPSDAAPGSVMADAPTVAIRMPRNK